MNQEFLIPAALVGWFVLLAVVETIFTRRDAVREPGGDARLVTNFGLTAIAIFVGSLLPVANVGSSVLAERLGIGLTEHAEIPFAAVIALTLLGQTFAGYWVHRLMHVSPLFWRMHRVHHADTSVDVSTSLRNHPLEMLIALPASAAMILLIGAPPSAVIATQTIFTATTIWQHADIRLPRWLDRALGVAIFTPRLHRLHHSPERSVHDSNYGACFILWDWLFGTLNRTEGHGRVGLRDEPIRPHNLFQQICAPLYPLAVPPKAKLNPR